MTVADLLRELIRIPSVNPDGDPGTTYTGEKECAKFVADFLRSCDAEAWLEGVRVHPDFRRQRIAAQLVGAAHARARKKNCEVIRLETSTRNTAARFCGHRIHGRLLTRAQNSG